MSNTETEATNAETVSEETQETTTEANASENTDETNESAQTEDAGTDWKAESRKWESRAKENKEKATAHDVVVQERDSLTAKVSELTADMEKAAEDLRASAHENLILRLRVKYDVSEEDARLFMTATDEETLEKQAERLSVTSARAPKPDSAQGMRNNTGPISVKQQGAAALGGLFK